MDDQQRQPNASEIQHVVSYGDAAERGELAGQVASTWPDLMNVLLESMGDAAVRRWMRAYLLDRLSSDAAGWLAGKLMEWRDDFHPGQRDRSTSTVVAHLTGEALSRHLAMLAGSNAAGALWDRLAHEIDAHRLLTYAKDVFERGDSVARETTLHLLVLDPYGPELLDHAQQNELLLLALDDVDPEIRGLAAEVVAAELPNLLLQRGEAAWLDESERVRMAYWNTALVHQPDEALEVAGGLVLDESRPIEARRTALIALGENLPTREVSPILEALLMGENQVLSEDAAQLMWRHHRAPSVANAAAKSPFDSVRELAERLLHPERGSPAAGGSRPGDPTRTGDIFDQITSSEDWRGPERER